MAELKNTTINDTSAIQLPVGTTAQRPVSASDGYVRFNSSFNIVEYYSNGSWSYLPDVVRDGLVLYLDAAEPSSYPGTGTTWTDLSGNGYNGTLQNSSNISFDSGNGGNLIFNSTGYVSTTGMQNYSYTNGITVEVWIYNTGGDYRGVVNNGISGDRFGGFDFRFGREDYFGGANNGTKLNWAIRDSSGNATATSINANLNVWGNYVGVYNNQLVSVYKNGSFFDEVLHSTGNQLKTVNNSTTVGWSIGTDEYLSKSTSNVPLSIVKIYNRALRVEEIQQNFNATRGRFGI